jgi:hypothetical protein
MTNIENLYNEQDFAAIIASFQPDPTFDPATFREVLERCVWLYLEGRKLRKKITKPAGRPNRIRSLSKNVNGLLRGLNIARDDPDISRFLTNAISTLHSGLPENREKQPEDCSEFLNRLADKALAQALAERQLDELVDCLNWSRQVLDVAERDARAQGIRKGGKRPDAELHELILSLCEIYEGAAAHPRKLSGHDVDSETENEDHEFLKFLRTATCPLGIRKSDAAWRELYRRAKTAAGGL